MSDLVAALRAKLDAEEQDAGDLHLIDCEVTRPTPFPCSCHHEVTVLRRVAAHREIVASYEKALTARRSGLSDLATTGAILALLGVVKALAVAHDIPVNKWGSVIDE